MMSKLSYAFDGGTPGLVERRPDGTMRFKPSANQSGCQWFYICLKLEGLAAGDTEVVEIEWPRIWREEDCPAAATEEQVRRWTTYDSFCKAAVYTVIRSSDRSNWRPVTGVTRNEQEDVLHIPVVGDGCPVYLATQRPYCYKHYEQLVATCRDAATIEVETVGLSQAGLDLHAMRVEPCPGGPTVYLQAYQHATEFSGPLIVDAMLRLVAAGEVGNINLHMVPVVDVDALYYGMPLLLAQTQSDSLRRRYPNPNREWKAPHWPEVRAVRTYLQRQVAAGTRYAVALDLHNGWYMAHTSGATYTIGSEKDGVDENCREQQRHFVDFMYACTDHQQPGSYWQHDADGATFAANAPAFIGAPAHTIEFSRHIWWDRQLKRFVPVRPEFHERYARQALLALAEYV